MARHVGALYICELATKLKGGSGVLHPAPITWRGAC